MKIMYEGTAIYKIHDGLYQRGRMHDIPLDRKVSLFEHFHIKHVVGLAPARIDPGLEHLEADNCITYIFDPIADGILDVDTAKRMLSNARILAKAIDKGEGVLCHCNAGRNRSGLMNALILRSLLKCTGAQALEMVRAERPRAVGTVHFEDFLNMLQRPK